MNKIILVVALLLHEALSSLVIDRYSQDGIHVSDYCPDMPYCTEGSHVMCMYYNPNQTMGPRCENPQNVTMNTLLANKLLDFTNAIRGKIALGKEKGQNGTPLPKAYGMMRVEWDSELATIAQVFANQCLMSHDLCRATKRFQDPGQTMGLCRFLFPTWQELTHNEHRDHTSPGLTIGKLLHAMNQVVKSWYTRKNSVHADMIMNYPDWSQTATIPKLYMELIYAPITHMGCGLSAYTAYDYHSRSDVNFNVVQVVCNFSARPHRGQQVYNTEPPSEVGYTIKCGCPPGYDEDNDCLCYETKRKAVTVPPDPKREGSCTDDANCKPSVVLLPIFTVENAPPEKLMTRKESNYRTRFETNIPELDILDTPIQAMNTSALQRMQNIRRPANIQSVLNKIIQEAHPTKYIAATTTTTTRPWGRDVRNRFFDKKTTPRSSFHPKIGRVLGYSPTKKESIFSKVPTFDLKRKTYNTYKQDVKPRRDFSDVKNLVRSYMSNRKGRIDNADILVMSPVTAKRSKARTETVLNSAEEKVMNNNFYTNKINSNSSMPKGKFDKFSDLDSIKAPNEKNDDTLMHLLDKLEREVRYAELDGSRKEMFDAKIRKIYGTVVGKPVDLLPRTHLDKYDTDLTDYETADFERYENDRGRYPDFDNRERSAKTLHHKLDEFSEQGNRIDPSDKYFDLEQKGRPMARNRNSLVLDDKPEKEHNMRSLKKTNYDLELERRYDYDRQKGVHKSMYREDDEFKSRHTYNEKAEKLRGLLSEMEEKREFDDIVDKRRIRDNEHNDDPLGPDRRKYYQAKLENLERKLQSTRSRYKNLKENNVRQLRVVRPTARDEEPLRPAKIQGNPFYMPDRARFLHGF